MHWTVTRMTSWRDVPGYEGVYQVSSLGQVRRVTAGTPHLLNPWQHPAGYRSVSLHKDKKGKKLLVHRLVAAAFIPNPAGLPQVNHINGIKTDNRVENLEWCDNRGNALHSAYVLGNESTIQKRPVRCVDTGETFDSIQEAARAVNGCNQNIVKCCQGKRKHHKGLRWAYIEEEAT